MTIQTWSRWAADIEALGIAFSPAPEYPVFPSEGRPLKPYAAVVRAAAEAAPLLAELRPDAVVADILTLAPALAAELAGIPAATLIPHVHPRGRPGLPRLLDRRAPPAHGGRAGALAGARAAGGPRARARTDRAQRDAPAARPRAARAPARRHQPGALPGGHVPGARVPAGLGAARARRRAAAVGAADRATSASRRARSRSSSSPRRPRRTPTTACCGPRSTGSTACPCACSRRGTGARPGGRCRPRPTPSSSTGSPTPGRCPRRRSSSATAATGRSSGRCSCGAAVVACPAAGDMNENAARVDWAGVGVRVPRRLVSPLTVRLAVTRAPASAAIRGAAEALGPGAGDHDAAARAAGLVERLAAGPRPPAGRLAETPGVGLDLAAGYAAAGSSAARRVVSSAQLMPRRRQCRCRSAWRSLGRAATGSCSSALTATASRSPASSRQPRAGQPETFYRGRDAPVRTVDRKRTRRATRSRRFHRCPRPRIAFVLPADPAPTRWTRGRSQAVAVGRGIV